MVEEKEDLDNLDLASIDMGSEQPVTAEPVKEE